MFKMPRALLASVSLLATGLSLALPVPALAIPVFDAANHTTNMLQAARALEQINHQIVSLQNEARMIQSMARNLERIEFPELGRISQALGRIDRLMAEAGKVDGQASAFDQRLKSLFPGGIEQAMRSDQALAGARARLDRAMGAYRDSMRVQAEVVANVREDSGLLGELVDRSQSAVGALQVSQATNQLLALSAKQQFQLQQLLAAEFRGASLDRARRQQSEEDARAATRRFLGTGQPRRP